MLTIEKIPGLEELGKETAKQVAEQAATITQEAGSKAIGFFSSMVGDPKILALGIILIVAAIVVIFFIKRIIINSVLGLIAWAVLKYYFQVELPFIPSLAASIIFGLAGIGTMLVLKFFGVI